MEELKSCPFFGSSNVNNLPPIQGERAVWFPAEITCEQCGANTNSVKQWNTRAIDPLMEEMANRLNNCLVLLEDYSGTNADMRMIERSIKTCKNPCGARAVLGMTRPMDGVISSTRR